MLIQQTRDQRNHRLAAYGTRNTKGPYIKTAFPNMTCRLCLAWAVAFNPLGLTTTLPTHVTFTHQNVPAESHIRHYSKIPNPVQHGQHLHNQLDSLPIAQPVQPSSSPIAWATLHSGVNFSCTGSIAVPWMWTWPGYRSLLQLCCRQQNPSRALLLLIITPGGCALFWQGLARYFVLLWIDWGKQAPPAEQLLRHVCQQKRRSRISKSAPSARAPKRCRKNNFPPARGWASASASATASWTTAREALQEGSTSGDTGLGHRRSLLLSLPLAPRLTGYMTGPSFPPHSSFALYIYGRSFSRQRVPLIWDCAIVRAREPNFKWSPCVLLHQWLWTIST